MMLPRLVVLMLGVVAGAASPSLAQAPVLQVEEATPAALTKSLDQVRQMRSQGIQGPVVVALPSGVYRLEETLQLSADLVARGLTLKAVEPKGVVFSGGARLSPRRDADGNWRYPLPGGNDAAVRPRVVVVDGQLCPAARFPNEGYLRIERVMEDRRSGFTARPGDLPAELEDVAAQSDLILLHDWSSSRLPVASYEADSRELRTLGPIGCAARHYAIDHFEKHPRYWLEGGKLLADAPGEWYVDAQSGEIVIIAQAGDVALPPEVVLPRLTEILVAAGSDATPLHNLVLEGITFTESAFPTPPGGIAASQATMYEPRGAEGERLRSDRPMLAAAVHLRRAEGCRVVNCRFRALGGTALWIGERTNRCTVVGCTFCDVGGNGLNLGEDRSRKVDGRSWFVASPEQVPTGNRVERCEIGFCGQILPGAVGIWAALHEGLLIADCRLRDLPYTGISLGWIWNDMKSPAARNRIRGNRIRYVMQVLSDGGGVYTLGRQPESVIDDNFISDIPLNAGRAESNGMFLDQGTAGFTIRGNTIRRVARSPLRFHQAKENLVVNNRWTLATPGTPPIRYNNTPEENIVVKSNTVLEPQQRIYLIGNSLTWDTIPSRLAQSVEWHVDCGKSLDYIIHHPENPCVASSRVWPLALRTAKYDFVTVQPHYGKDLEEDLKVINHWLAMQPEAVFVVHTGWAPHAKLLDEYADADPAGRPTHSTAYYNALLKRLRSQHPDREFRRTHAMDLLREIADDIAAGKAPWSSIDEIYRDSIHMTHGAGRYLMHNCMRHTLGQPRSSEGFKVRPEIKAYLDRLLDGLP